MTVPSFMRGCFVRKVFAEAFSAAELLVVASAAVAPVRAATLRKARRVVFMPEIEAISVVAINPALVPGCVW